MPPGATFQTPQFTFFLVPTSLNRFWHRHRHDDFHTLHTKQVAFVTVVRQRPLGLHSLSERVDNEADGAGSSGGGGGEEIMAVASFSNLGFQFPAPCVSFIRDVQQPGGQFQLHAINPSDGRWGSEDCAKP